MPGLNIRQIATAGGTLAAIAGIGFFMQSGQTGAPQHNQSASFTLTPTPAATPAATVEPKVETPGGAPLKVTDIRLTSSQQPGTGAAVAGNTITPARNPIRAPITQPVQAPATAGDSCKIAMQADAGAAGLVNVSIKAPCLPGERLTLHHNGMMFTEITDKNGGLEITVPALAELAVFIASFKNGESAVANTIVPSLTGFERTVVQSNVDAGVSLHAYEFGAEFGQPGHISAASMGDPVATMKGEGGFLIQLGARDLPGALIAEVYTYPSAKSARDGGVGLSAEVEISADNCGKEISAQSLQTNTLGQVQVQDLEMAMPDCDAVGDFLVLKNLVNDLKVARK